MGMGFTVTAEGVMHAPVDIIWIDFFFKKKKTSSGLA